jgi:hypothetical protein
MVQDAAYTYHQRLWRSSIYQKNLFQLTPSEEEVVSSNRQSYFNLYTNYLLYI